MKNRYLLYIGIASLALSFPSCKKDFQDLNTNQNSLTTTKPEFLFTTATLNYKHSSRGRIQRIYDKTLLYMQYTASDVNTEDGLSSAYADPLGSRRPSPTGSLLNDYYGSTGRDLNRLIDFINKMPDQNLKQSYTNLLSVTKILYTYDSWTIADAYGAMAYSQAFQPSVYPLPQYDYYWDLYKQFDKQVKDAVDVLKTNPANQISFSANDYFYQGNISKWIKFGNTLRIKMAQRLEKRDAAFYNSVLADIATNYSGQIISSIDEQFTYYTPSDFYENGNVDDINNLWKNYDASFAFVEFLKSTSDPRIKFMIRENDWGPNYSNYNDLQANGTPAALAEINNPQYNTSRYQGKHAFPASGTAAYGFNGQIRTHTYSTTSGQSRTLSYNSLIQTRFFIKNGGFKTSDNGMLHTDEEVGVAANQIKYRIPLMGYADVCFMMAEIAAKGGNGLGKAAAQWYNDGVQASFNDYKAKAVEYRVPGASSVVLGDLLTRYPYNGLPSIYSQAWVNFFENPDEAWAMWKRTGYPQFENYVAGQPSKIGDGSGIAYLQQLRLGSGSNLVIPRRGVLDYTSTDLTPNIDKAVNDLKTKDAAYGDRVDTRGRVWWDMP